MKIPSNRVVYYHHRGNFSGTFAIRAIPYEGDKALKVEVGYAFCSNSDNFSKKKGRLVALNRLASQRALLLPVEDCDTYHEIMIRAVTALYGIAWTTKEGERHRALPRHVMKAVNTP